MASQNLVSPTLNVSTGGQWHIKFALQLMGAPASSASIERVFSTFGLVHSKLRNRLGVERASKLVFCYRMLRGPVEIDY